MRSICFTEKQYSNLVAISTLPKCIRIKIIKIFRETMVDLNMCIEILEIAAELNITKDE